jgi:predicted dehydrogenase
MEPFRGSFTRRRFLRAAAAATVATPSLAHKLAAQSPERIRVGLVGCGLRGLGAARNVVVAAPNVDIVALADVFEDRVQDALTRLATPNSGSDREGAEGRFGTLDDAWTPEDVKHAGVRRDCCFTGFDAYKRLLECGVDLVLLATPPCFRPMQARAAIEAGKHVFAEKPVAVDPVGVRSILETARLARQKNLAFMGGTQLRQARYYRETMDRILNGQIGDVVAGDCSWFVDVIAWRYAERKPGMSDMEYQIRNWNYYTWASGDLIVEMLIHNIDVLNWAMGSPPKKAIGFGGRTQRTQEKYGNVYDHFYVEYEYPNGTRMTATTRQMDKCTYRNGERIVGTRGVADPSGTITGEKPFEYGGPFENPLVTEQRVLLESIRSGRPLNNGEEVASSTMTAILGRMVAYTGRAVSYDWALKSSRLDLTPPHGEWKDLPVEAPAVAGVTPLV